MRKINEGLAVFAAESGSLSYIKVTRYSLNYVKSCRLSGDLKDQKHFRANSMRIYGSERALFPAIGLPIELAVNFTCT
jgi:hypothetical protein